MKPTTTQMEKQISILFLFLLSINFISISTGYTSHEQGQEKSDHQGSLKLFVFGDSFADTGNQKKSMSSWKKPYGMTFPGKPAGRFSDGRVLTDYIASFFGIESPVPYALRKYARKSDLGHGMNFAYGGSGVFNTVYQAPNMTIQIDFFQKLVESKLYTKSELRSSIAHVSVTGNDYITYTARNPNQTIEGTKAFTRSVIMQMTMNLKRISGLGLRKIMVTGMEPLGCLPFRSGVLYGFKSCDATYNKNAKFHNKLLRKAVHRMNSERGRFVFGILDLYTAFMSIRKREFNSGDLDNPWKPCCVGVNRNYKCGDVDEKGEKMYVVCNDPKSSIFWDGIHPSQNGWHSVYMALQPDLHKVKDKTHEPGDGKKNEDHVVLVKDYKSKVETELSAVCAGILKLLDLNLIPSATASESKVFYLKMKGDYHRYMAEFKAGEEKKAAADDTMIAYKAVTVAVTPKLWLATVTQNKILCLDTNC